MKVFSRKRYINDFEILKYKTKEQLENFKWAKDCDGQEIKNGYVTDKEGKIHFVSDNWIEEKDIVYRYYIILAGETGYRAYYFKESNEPDFYTYALTRSYRTSQQVNELLDRVGDQTEYFRNFDELNEHLSESTVGYIYLFESGKWEAFKRDTKTGMMEQLKIKIKI
jgi:hypothetical protein